jgi:phytoene synthase
LNEAAAGAASAAAVAQRSRSSFLLSFGVLEPARRDALTAVYAFCRVIDDAVDEAADAESGARQLAFWRDELARAARREEPRTPLGEALAAAIAAFGVDEANLLQVWEGVRMDLAPPCFADLPALEAYCYKVASAVGLACLPVFGARGPAAEAYAVELGKALQLTNILRDLRGDARAGRVYLPRAWLAEAGVDPAWLAGDGPRAAYAAGGPVHAVVRRGAAAAQARFASAAAALDACHERQLLLPAEVMAAVYRELLARVERRGGDLRRPRALRVPRWRQALLLWRTRRRLLA